MSNIDKFNLGTAIIGLIADIIGISVFIGTLQFSPETATSASPSHLATLTFFIISAFLLLYGWLIICWVLIRRSIAQAPNPDFADIAYRTVLGIGAIISPLIFIWWINAGSAMSVSNTTTQVLIPWGLYLIYSLVTFAFAGSLILTIIVALMPVINSEIPSAPVEAAFRKPFHLFTSLFQMSKQATKEILNGKDIF